jgi:hypothetical protein
MILIGNGIMGIARVVEVAILLIQLASDALKLFAMVKAATTLGPMYIIAKAGLTKTATSGVAGLLEAMNDNDPDAEPDANLDASYEPVVPDLPVPAEVYLDNEFSKLTEAEKSELTASLTPYPEYIIDDNYFTLRLRLANVTGTGDIQYEYKYTFKVVNGGDISYQKSDLFNVAADGDVVKIDGFVPGPQSTVYLFGKVIRDGEAHFTRTDLTEASGFTGKTVDISEAEFNDEGVPDKHDHVPVQDAPAPAPQTVLTDPGRAELVQSLTPNVEFIREENDTAFTFTIELPDLSGTGLTLEGSRCIYEDGLNRGYSQVKLEEAGGYEIKEFAAFDTPGNASTVTCRWNYVDASGQSLIVQQQFTAQGTETDGITGFVGEENTEIQQAEYEADKPQHERDPAQEFVLKSAPAPAVHLDKPFDELNETERSELAGSLTPALADFQIVDGNFNFNLHTDTNLELVDFKYLIKQSLYNDVEVQSFTRGDTEGVIAIEGRVVYVDPERPSTVEYFAKYTEADSGNLIYTQTVYTALGDDDGALAGYSKGILNFIDEDGFKAGKPA